MASVFKLADLAQFYTSRMEQLGVKHDGRDYLLTFLTCAQHQGRDVLLAFNEDLGDALAKACELDRYLDGIHLARAAQIVRRHIFGDAKVFNGFHAGCQQDSVLPMLLALISMILEGPSIKHQRESTTPATLTIAQFLKFNSLKQHVRRAIYQGGHIWG